MIKIGLALRLKHGRYNIADVNALSGLQGIVAEVHISSYREFSDLYIGDILDWLEELPLPIYAIKLPKIIETEDLEKGVLIADQVAAKYLIVESERGLHLDKESLRLLAEYGITLCLENPEGTPLTPQALKASIEPCLALSYNLSGCRVDQPVKEVIKYIGYVKVIRAFNVSNKGTRLPLFHPDGLWNLNRVVKLLSGLPREILLILDYPSDVKTYVNEVNRIKELARA